MDGHVGVSRECSRLSAACLLLPGQGPHSLLLGMLLAAALGVATPIGSDGNAQGGADGVKWMRSVRS